MSENENRPVRNRAEQRQSWAERLQRFADSGLSVVAFCQAERIPTQSFYYWKRKLDSQISDAPTAPARLLPIRLLPSCPIEVVLPSGIVLKLSAGCDLDLLRNVLSALEDRSC